MPSNKMKARNSRIAQRVCLAIAVVFGLLTNGCLSRPSPAVRPAPDGLRYYEAAIGENRVIFCGAADEQGGVIRHGAWVKLHTNGKPWIRRTYIWNKPAGVQLTYYDNGQLCNIGEIRDGKQHGLWAFFDDVGNLTSTQKLNGGRAIWEQFHDESGVPTQHRDWTGRPDQFFEWGRISSIHWPETCDEHISGYYVDGRIWEGHFVNASNVSAYAEGVVTGTRPLGPPLPFCPGIDDFLYEVSDEPMTPPVEIPKEDAIVHF